MNKIKNNTPFLFFILILLIFIIFLWANYWRIQLLYNSSAISMYTPDIFSITSNKFLETEYYNILEKGKNESQNQKIIICSLLRNVESNNGISSIISKTEKIGSLFKDYRILIVENDSTDKTRELLLNWNKKNPKVKILGCGENVKFCSMPFAKKKTIGHFVDRPRIKKMVKLRNIYLQELKKQKYSDYKYCIFWDLDVIGSVYIDGVLHSIGLMKNNINISMICAYGIYKWLWIKIYYDTYAHVDIGENFNFNNKAIHDMKKGLFSNYKRGDKPLEVSSCFSGFSIYLRKFLLPNNVLYTMTPETEKNLECEHVRLHKSMGGIKLMNPSMINHIVLNK